MMAMDFPEHPFWDHAIATYGKEGVSQACLEIQERHGIDVNIVLFCVWFADSGRGRLNSAHIDAILAASRAWNQDVVCHIRQLRRALKVGFTEVPGEWREAFRRQIQATEIDAEHLEQLLIAAAAEGMPAATLAAVEDRATDATASVRAYLDAIKVQFSPADATDFAHILGQAFPGLTPGRALDLAEALM
jgi:uncharacterized protein (TIGR02444 family)